MEWGGGHCVISGVLDRRAGTACAAVLALAVTAMAARGADVGPPVLKTPAGPVVDWSGYYFGAHLGYAGGHATWSATDFGSAQPAAAGSFGMFNGFKPFEGDVYVEQPDQGRVRFAAIGPYVHDVKRNAPTRGTLDLCGLPW